MTKSDEAGPGPLTATQGLLRRTFAVADRWMNRLYGWRGNPLYQSGALVVLAIAIMLVTGLYLLLFYRIGSPYASVLRVANQPWAGQWMRSMHRYAADLAIAAALVHAVRMFFQGRSWGPRALAWVSGAFLLFLLYVCGWTGYVMVWDLQAQVLATEGARLLDVLPLFSEPITRTFVGEAPLPSAFFFLNLFLHIALPVGLAGFVWLHVSRVARPTLFPPRKLAWGVTCLLFLAAVLLPAPMDPEASLLRLPGEVSLDVFYSFWLPLTDAVSPGWIWGGLTVFAMAVLAVPFLTRPRAEHRPPASYVEPRFCTACEQCYVDCPYDAIRMVPRDDGREDLVAWVDPSLCVSCGICAGSCAPMGVGPPGRTGRDQLDEVRSFIRETPPTADRIVVVGCDRSAASTLGDERVSLFPTTCAGNLHTSVVEYLVRAGAGGVLIVACPPRDCWSREGPTWLHERLYEEREAELQERVDRRRVRVVHAALGDPGLGREIDAFWNHVRSLDRPSGEPDIAIDMECVLPEVEPVP